MGKAPAYQMYAQDFDMDTASWPNVAVGIYQRLLNYEWINKGLPQDLQELASVARERRKIFERNWIKFVSKKFHENGNGLLINRRMEEVRENQFKYSESRRKNVSVRYKDKRTYEDTREEHMELHTPRSSSSSSSSTPKKNKTYSENFLKFWEEYPNKKAKPLAFKEWNRLKPGIEIILPALKKQKEYKESLLSQGKFCPEWPHPERWIKNQRWLDEVEAEPIDATDRLIYQMKKEREKDEHT